MKDLKCPECGHEQNAYDIHEPEITHEIGCENCEKIYGVTVEWEPNYTCAIMPCANGKEHKMKKRVRAPRVINKQEEYYCLWCDHTENREADCSKNCDKDIECWECDK